ncbi:MAG: kanamycin kinase [Actinomycetota bacterium]
MATETIPARIRDLYADWRWTPAWTYDDVVTTWRIENDDATRYVKVKKSSATVTLRREAEAMRWTAKYLRVPEVLDDGSDDGLDWLVTAEMRGTSAIKDAWRADPEWLVPIVARGLRRMHEALPVADCPFRFTVRDALDVAGARAADGRETWDDMHEEHKHMTVVEAVARLEESAPAHEDLVVCHGDYCYPNVFIEGDEVTGYLDLGELGVADRWWDIAIGMWSTTWNVGPGYEELFADSYGVDIDADKLAYFRLQYDLVS